jgi:hypothetical protein
MTVGLEVVDVVLVVVGLCLCLIVSCETISQLQFYLYSDDSLLYCTALFVVSINIVIVVEVVEVVVVVVIVVVAIISSYSDQACPI